VNFSRHGLAVAQVVGPWPLTAEARGRSVGSQREICGRLRRIGAGVSPNIAGFALSIQFHQCSTLIFIYMLHLPEGQAVEVCEPAKKAMLIRKSESIGQKVLSLLLVFKRFRIILQRLSNAKKIYTQEIQTDNNKSLLRRLVKNRCRENHKPE